MKTKKPLRKISAKRMRELTSSGLRLEHNSTIARKPCNAITAARESISQKTISLSGNRTIPVHSGSALRDASRISISNSGRKQRKPVNKQSVKQKLRLQKLAAVRQKWWLEAQASGKPLNCGICDEEIRTREELASDHIAPGHGKSDEISNLQPSHGICNEIKGSRRNFKIVRGDKNWKIIHGLL